jgi:Flp pilus assembly protein TadG
MFLTKNKFLKKEKGASAVEFALILPVFILLIFAILQFGIVFTNWIAITYAAREGARLAAVDEFDEAVVRERVPSAKIESITVEGLEGDSEIGDPVTVNVTGQVLNFNVPFLSSKAFVLTSSATLRIEDIKN